MTLTTLLIGTQCYLPCHGLAHHTNAFHALRPQPCVSRALTQSQYVSLTWCVAAITFADIQDQALPRQGSRVLLQSSDAVVYGVVLTPDAYYFNFSIVAPTSSLLNLTKHPGFSIKPTFWYRAECGGRGGGSGVFC